MHANGKSFDFQKGGDDWFSNGKKMDSTSIQSFVDKLRDLAAAKFLDTPSLGAATADITVVSNNGKLTEKLLIAKQGSDYVAQRQNEPASTASTPRPSTICAGRVRREARATGEEMTAPQSASISEPPTVPSHAPTQARVLLWPPFHSLVESRMLTGRCSTWSKSGNRTNS